MGKMLKVVQIEHLPAKVMREVTNAAQGIVLIDCGIVRDEESEEPLLVLLHWRAGDWKKPPIDIALDEDTGHFQSLQLVLQDETIERNTLLSTDLGTLAPEEGLPVFELLPWSDEDYIDEHLQVSLSW